MTTTSGKPRARRIAADEAHSWARNLRLGNPHAKYVLCMLTLYVNGEGSCFVSVGQLADDCELAIETVRRRLTFLQQVGAIARFPQYLDEHGRRNGEGRGRRTSDDIRLLIAADEDEIEARAHANDKNEPDPEDGQTPPAEGGQTEPSSPVPQPGLDSISPPPRSLLGLYLDSNCGGGLTLEPEPEPEPESSPYPLPSTASETSVAPTTPLGDLQPLADAYPIPITNVASTRALWSALTDTERADVLTACLGYGTFLRANPKRAAKDAHRWLAAKDWLGYLDSGQKAARQSRERVEIVEGSEQWTAWAVYYACCRTTIPCGALAPRGSRRASMPSEWPPVGRGIDPDSRNWTKVYAGAGPFAAWLRRLREGPCMAIGLRSEVVDRVWKNYLLVPQEWPPKAAEPPTADSALSRQDADDFIKSA